MYALACRQKDKIRQVMCFTMLSYTHDNYFRWLGYNTMRLVMSTPGKKQTFQVCPATGGYRKEPCHFIFRHKMFGHLNAFLWYKLVFRDIEDSSGNWTGCASLDFSAPRGCFYFLVQRTTKSDRYGVLKILDAQWLILFPYFSCTLKHISREDAMLQCLWLQMCHEVGITIWDDMM